MKKKLLIGFIILVIIFLTYKILMLNIYKVAPVDFDKTTIFTDEIEVKNTKDIKSSEVLKVDELQIKNYFSKYEDAPGDSVFKVLKDKEDNIISFYYITSMKEYIDVISFESLSIYSEAKIDRINDSEVDSRLKKYFTKNNINNDIDLFNHIKDNYYFKSNILTSRKNLIINYLLNSFVSVSLPSFKSVSLIKGNLNGYIVNNESVREIHLLNNNKQYVIVLGGEVTSDDFINDLLETVHYK